MHLLRARALSHTRAYRQVACMDIEAAQFLVWIRLRNFAPQLDTTCGSAPNVPHARGACAEAREANYTGAPAAKRASGMPTTVDDVPMLSEGMISREEFATLNIGRQLSLKRERFPHALLEREFGKQLAPIRKV